MNNLDPDVAERPEELIVYGGTGQGGAQLGRATSGSSATLRRLENDETLLVQSGKPVGVFRTHEEAPRVLIANAHLVPRWATWDEFRRLEALGLTMYGQMTAGSWIYIGTQGILQGTYETFAECARQHFGGTLAGRLVVTGGLGGMGGAQPLAATMNGAAFLGVDVDERASGAGWTPATATGSSTDLDEALRAGRGRAARAARAVGRAGGQHRRGAARAGPPRRRARRAHRPDLGPRPARRATSRPADLAGEAAALRERDPAGYEARVLDSMVAHVEAMLALQARGRGRVRLRQQPARPGRRPPRDDATPSTFPGFVPAFIRPLFCRGAGPVPLGGALGRPGRHRRDRRRGAGDLSRRRSALARWIRQAQEQGRTSRACRRASAGWSTASGRRWGCGSTGW